MVLTVWYIVLTSVHSLTLTKQLNKLHCLHYLVLMFVNWLSTYKTKLKRYFKHINGNSTMLTLVMQFFLRQIQSVQISKLTGVFKPTRTLWMKQTTHLKLLTTKWLSCLHISNLVSVAVRWYTNLQFTKLVA